MRVVSPESMEMTTSANFKAPNRLCGSRVTGREKRGSKSYSSSEDDFHSDDNLRPYEEVKMAHNDKNLNSLGKSFCEWSTISHIILSVDDLKEEDFLKHCWENEKMLATSIFSFSHNIFFPF